MFNWLLGGKSENNSDQADDIKYEVPDTPAPVFVARAFKSALFGTPAPPESQVFGIEEEFEHTNGELSCKQSSNQPNDALFKKNPGILMTPGASTPWRKTVSFDHAMIENEKSSNYDATIKISCKNQEKPHESQTIKPNNQNTRARKTILTMQLENARERKKTDETHSNAALSEETLFSNPTKKIESRICSDSNLKPLRTENYEANPKEPTVVNEISNYDNGNTTLDLNKPFSESGIFWKSEYENYQREARLEMRKLLAFKEQAKSHAKLQDEHIKNLMEKIKQEQQKVALMEEKNSKLSAKIESTSKYIPRNDVESSNLKEQLDRHAARAVQYEELLKELEKLMRNNELNYETTYEEKSRGLSYSDTSSQSDIEISKSLFTMKLQIKNLNKKLQEVSSLEILNKELRELTQQKDNTISALKNDNEQLLQKLLRLDTEHERPNNNNLSNDEYSKSATQAQRKLNHDCEVLKSKPRFRSTDSGHLMKKINDRESKPSDIDHLKSSDANSTDIECLLSKKSLEYEPPLKSNETCSLVMKTYQLKGIINNTPQLESEGITQKSLMPGSPANASKSIHDNDVGYLNLNQSSLPNKSVLDKHAPIKVLDHELRSQSCYEVKAEEIKHANAHHESQKKSDNFTQGFRGINQDIVNDLPGLNAHDNNKSSFDYVNPASQPIEIKSQNHKALQSFEPYIKYSFKNKFEKKIEESSRYSPSNKTNGNHPRISLPPERIEAAKQRLAAKKRQSLILAGSISMNKS